MTPGEGYSRVPRYTDELEPLLEREVQLRRLIALRLAQEAGLPSSNEPDEAQMESASEAIRAWSEEREDAQDERAFRPIGPLEQLLIDHRQVADRIADIWDQRLS